jgi:hypothetical protein
MATALRRSRSWASMKARWGSQADAVGATAGGVTAGVTAGAGAGAGGRAGGICSADPAATAGQRVATPGEFAAAAAANRFR